MIPTDSAATLVSHLRTVGGLKVVLTHAGTVAVKPKTRITEEMRAAIATVGIDAIRVALAAERMPVERVPGDTRPERPGKVADLMQDARATWAIIQAANDPPRLFRHAGLAWVEPDDEGRPGIVQLEAARLTHYVSETILFVVERAVGDTIATVPVPPPSVLVRELLATPDLPAPVLTRIVTAPIMTRTGAIHERPGYDAVSKAFYAPAPGFVVPPLSANPTSEEIQAARDLLYEVLQDFPFVSDADVAHTIAAILTPFVRDLVDGPTPLVLIMKPAPGTGATLLANVIILIIAGDHVGPLTECEDEAEWKKTITARLETGPSVVYLDNLTGELRSGQLSAAITATTWEGRRLGATEIVKFPIRCSWLGTGNNVKLNTDLARRTIRVALDAQVERPWLRTGPGLDRRGAPLDFRHADLLEWVRRERPRLVHAALTLALAWIAGGRRAGQKKLGGFEPWSRVLGGVLDVAGVPGFLANIMEMYEESDIEASEARRFLGAWWISYGADPKPPGDLFGLATSVDVALRLSGQTDHARRSSFGHFLGRHQGRPYAIEDGLNVVITKASTSHRALWRLANSNGSAAQGSHPSQGSPFLRARESGNPNGVQKVCGEAIDGETSLPSPRTLRDPELNL